MFEFRMLGSIELTDEGGLEVDALLRQPKHLALLGYLALPHPGAWHNRDEVVGALWPENDQARARSALRTALHNLRRHLPEGAIRSRGDDAISIDPLLLRTDVARMMAEFDAGEHQAALSRYRGELLAGLYVPDSPTYDAWLTGQRRRIRAMAHKCATQLSIALQQRNDIAGAIEAARTASELEPDDEATVRHWISLLDRAGDRTQAFAVYERFRDHTMDAFGIRPSAETVALLDAIRTRHLPAAQDHSLPSGVSATPVAASTEVPPAAKLRGLPARRIDRRWLLLALPLGAAGAAFIAVRPQDGATSAAPARSIVILPMVNATGDTALAYVATGIADGVARRLHGIGGLAVHSGARSDWDFGSPPALKAVGTAFGSHLLIKSRIARVGDSLEVSASVVDATSLETTPVATHRFSTSTIRDVQGKLAADIAGTLFRAPIPTSGRSPVNDVDTESYRLTLEGWHMMVSNIQLETLGQSRANKVAALFRRAIDIDPLNARAWSGLSSAYTSQTVTDAVPFDEGFDRATAAALRALAIDSLQGTALANMGNLNAMKHRRLSAGLELIRKAEVLEPWNPEIFLIEGAVLLNAHQWDAAKDAFRVARKLDPLSSFYAGGEARADFCVGRGKAPLALFDSHLAFDPTDRLSLRGRTRALAMLYRFDEAIASWRNLAQLEQDTVLAAELAAASGAEGYWRVVHSDGRRRLALLERASGYSSPLRYVQAYFAAGDSERAYSWLQRAEKAGIRQLYRLQCMPAVDEYRNTQRFREAIVRIGSLAQ